MPPRSLCFAAFDGLCGLWVVRPKRKQPPVRRARRFIVEQLLIEHPREFSKELRLTRRSFQGIDLGLQELCDGLD
ncbi:MAG: hypothetical protein M3O46_08950, partial [Myxococcota bacterium]|nr:hypothetical protein [Myxococcota bacterium]